MGDLFIFAAWSFRDMEDIRSTTECTKFFWWLRLSVLIKVTYSVRS